MADSETVATKFMVVSDTHNFQFDNSASGRQKLRLPTPGVDVLLHCGDLTQVGGLSSFKKALSMVGKIDAELKLVIAGNHDLELDQAYWESQCDHDGNPEDPEDHRQVIKLLTGPLAAEAGVKFLNEGTHTFYLQNGVEFSIYVSPYTPAFGDWAFAYEPSKDRFNDSRQTAGRVTSIATNPMPTDVDIVMTHGPPKGILDYCPQGNVGCGNLFQAIRRVKPKMHCFGHIHESNGLRIVDWSSSRVTSPLRHIVRNSHGQVEEKECQNTYPKPFVWRREKSQSTTLAVNAAIMTAEDKPENAPWLINLDLPLSE